MCRAACLFRLQGSLIGPQASSRRLHYLFTPFVLLPVLGHIALATIHPRTRASLRGMLSGVVDAAWAREHHPRWYAEISRGARDPVKEGGRESREREAVGR